MVHDGPFITLYCTLCFKGPTYKHSLLVIRFQAYCFYAANAPSPFFVACSFTLSLPFYSFYTLAHSLSLFRSPSFFRSLSLPYEKFGVNIQAKGASVISENVFKRTKSFSVPLKCRPPDVAYLFKYSGTSLV